MMKNLLILVLVCLCACNEKKAAPENIRNKEPDTAIAVKFFPALDFLKSEMAIVDSLPVGIKKFVTTGAKTDSQYIGLEEFHQLADEFLAPELNEVAFANEFTETAFYDKTTNRSTFLYTTRNNALELQRVDILSATGDTYDKVKSVYLEKRFQNGDTAIVKKLFWKPERHFQISILASTGLAKPVPQLIKVVWDNRD